MHVGEKSPNAAGVIACVFDSEIQGVKPTTLIGRQMIRALGVVTRSGSPTTPVESVVESVDSALGVIERDTAEFASRKVVQPPRTIARTDP